MELREIYPLVDIEEWKKRSKNWRNKLEEMRLQIRKKFDSTEYEREDLKWYQSAFMEGVIFLYDKSVYDRENDCYRVEKLLEEAEREFGGYDFIILWHAYPRIGIDERNQFDFYRDMPGGLNGLRDFVSRAHKHGTKVFIDYNPWDIGTRRETKVNTVPDSSSETIKKINMDKIFNKDIDDSRYDFNSDAEALAKIVEAIDADGVFLDVMYGAYRELREKLDKVRPGIVFDSEGASELVQAELCTGSWEQGSIPRMHGNMPPPNNFLTLKWVEPRFSLRGVDRASYKRTTLIALGFFHGIGHVIWENIFGWWNPFSAEDRTLLRRCNMLLHAHSDAFTDYNWQPYIDTLQKEISVHRWHAGEKTVYTVWNGKYHGYDGFFCAIMNIAVKENMEIYDVWNGGKVRTTQNTDGTLTIHLPMDQLSCGCIVIQPKSWPPPISADITPSIDNPSCHRVKADAHFSRFVGSTAPISEGEAPEDMVMVSEGEFLMKVDCVSGGIEGGCYSYVNRRGHPDRKLYMKGFFIDKTEVTNAEYKKFLDATGYTPQILKNFLKHWINRDKEDITSWQISTGIENHPVVYVDLDDARAYAQWAKKRLPTEEEWQYAAQENDERIWPWGNEFNSAFCNGLDGTIKNLVPVETSFGKTTSVDAYPNGKSPWGCLDMCGNVWEWTESERDDGHTRYAIIRGGSHFRPGGSNWYVTGGAQPCNKHAKILLLYPGLDRCSTIGFRCVKDTK